MQPSIFTRIISGELPYHKIYEDANTLAFLNIHPTTPGHTLVVPKKQITYIEDMSADEFQTLMTSVKKVVDHMSQVFGSNYRIVMKVAGFDVPHVHVHVQPCRTPDDFWRRERPDDQPDHAALAEMALKLAFTDNPA